MGRLVILFYLFHVTFQMNKPEMFLNLMIWGNVPRDRGSHYLAGLSWYCLSFWPYTHDYDKILKSIPHDRLSDCLLISSALWLGDSTRERYNKLPQVQTLPFTREHYKNFESRFRKPERPMALFTPKGF